MVSGLAPATGFGWREPVNFDWMRKKFVAEQFRD